MTDADRPNSSAAGPFATGFAVALASLLLEVVLPWVIGPEGDRFVPDQPLVRPVFLAGAFLRVPLTAAVFAGLAWVFAPDGKRLGVGRGIVYLLASSMFVVDAASYRWLGARGKLFHPSSVLSPLEAVGGKGAVIVAAAVLIALALALASEAAMRPALERRLARPGAALADTIGLVLLAVIGIGGIVGARGSLSLGITPPLVALLDRGATSPDRADEHEHEHVEEPVPEDGVVVPPADLRQLVHAALGTESAEPLADPGRPFCRTDRPTTGNRPAPRSLVLLAVRGLEAQAIAGATPSMPQVAAAVRDEARFERVIAGADDPTQGLVQILSGVAPLAPSRYHEMARVPRLPSLPAALRDLGIDSHFVSTTDLSPGRERTYLEGLGFTSLEEPSFESELAADPAVPPARVALSAVSAKLAATRGRPRLVAATLGSALSGGLSVSDPSQLPAARAAALASLDAELAAFITQFRADEAPSGTVLVLVGDSVDPTVVVRADGDEASRPAFHVPLVLMNLRAEERTLARTRSTMLAGLLDVAQTLLGLEGQGPTGCFQGRDLLSTREPLPSERRLPAFAGADQRYAYVFDTRFRWQLDRTAMEAPFSVYDLEEDAGLVRNLYDEADPDVGAVREFTLSMVALGRYLASNDRFVPGTPQIVAMPLPAVDAPARVGVVDGASVAELSRGIAARASEGLGTVVLNVGFDGTGRPSLAGQPLGTALSALVRPLRGIRLMLDIALPEPTSPERSVMASRALVEELAAARTLEAPVLMPRDPLMATSLANRSDYRVYVRLPGNALALIDAAHGFGVHGIVFGNDLASGVIVERARLMGLYVAVDDVARFEAVRELGGGQLPDYLILRDAESATP